MSISPADFMARRDYPARARRDPTLVGGSTPWAQEYLNELKSIVLRYADRLPRNVQRHLGPSEIGHECDRMLIGKMAGTPRLNFMTDPWASIVGTALHAFMDQAFTWDNQDQASQRGGVARWRTEGRVTPDPQAVQPHPGTADLYDYATRTLVDWKMQATSVRARLRTQGPPQHYFVQLLLYALGYMNLGYPVERVVLVSWPRTESTMDDAYAWEHVITEADLAMVADVLRKTEIREQLAVEVAQGRMSLWSVPATPSSDACHWCDYLRPQSAIDGSYGCPGTLLLKP